MHHSRTKQKTAKLRINTEFNRFLIMPATGIEPVREVSPAGF